MTYPIVWLMISKSRKRQNINIDKK